MTMTLAEGLPIDLQALLETRMLIQANAGGGKSFAIRRLIEQTASSVQQLVIDVEGEFATLREKHDFIICAAHDADAIATPQTASLLALRLLESGVSAVLDIYDLKPHDRQLFVKRFLESLINAPRKLRHSVLIVLDEAHVFCPQAGSTEATPAVIDIAARGRKRGLCLIAATQRLSKLHKDVAAELLNKLIGRTGLDVDVKRAADELGMTAKDALLALRPLDPGEFYAFGPALCREPLKITIGPVATTHPKAGQRLLQAPPPASPKVRAQLAKLADLQKDADTEARTVEELQRQNAELLSKIKAAEKRASQAGVPEVEVQRRIAQAVKESATQQPMAVPSEWPKVQKLVGQLAALISPQLVISGDSKISDPVIHINPRAFSKAMPAPAPGPVSDGINAAQQRILDVLAQLEAFGLPSGDRSMVGAHAGVSPTSGGYFNNLGKLRSAGFIDYPVPGTVALSDAGRALANKPDATPTLDDFHESWFRILPAPQAAILRHVVACHPANISRDELADAIGVSRTSGGYFNNLGRLRTLGAIDYPQKGTVRAAAVLFPQKAYEEATRS